ncbi:metallophosphoesterase [Ktedonosporobacter rubrisoli]|uniref:Metallophosphoesterase n=1 Tax=Ktedonosporobacter rubrisoli TaxID=2509675 RepID=A0A4V0YZD6_KTERU|nr:metallophosphoesterase family protein [Ktedonosporobacter rubrisoli]QBD79351.1 metallophosphoesterase [Ktedonosporobacter rubrisoli]
MRLALISDIHGNHVALEAVLSAISPQNISQVICLGDVASTGPQPCEVIKRLRELGCPVVMGNMDAWLLQPELKAQPDLRRQRWQEIDMWCARQLSSADRAYLSSFQSGIVYPLPNGKTLVCYHGSPRSYNERILPTTSEEELEQALAGAQGTLMVGGHTHVQMFRRFRDLLVFNPGSVGLAMDRVSPLSDIRQPAFAEYALVECDKASLQVELHRIAFDLQAFIQAMHASGMPHAAWWASHWHEA